jgi:beta-galactosidase
MLDVIGQNYRPAEILAAHAQKPSRKIVGTENTHERNQWVPVRDNPPYSGMFVWAGTDYLGESRHWPIIGDASGLDDRTDAPKPDALERESWWKTEPVVHIVRRVAAVRRMSTDPGYEPGSAQALALGNGAQPAAATAVANSDSLPVTAYQDWTPANLGPHEENVEVFSNCAEVELSLNGASLGSKAINADASPRKWMVPFAAGALKAACKDKAASETLHTAGKAAKLVLTVERAKLSMAWDDVAYVRATVVDEQGTRVPDASMPLTFAVSGPARILATDNGDNADNSGFQKPERNAFHGSAIAVLRATAAKGDVVVKVSAEGLTGASATLHVSP